MEMNIRYVNLLIKLLLLPFPEKCLYQVLMLMWDKGEIIPVTIALLKAQICMISFQTCSQIFGIHKALIHVNR